MTPEQRRQEIGKLIWDAVTKAAGVDWSQDSPEVSRAEVALDEAMYEYVQGSASKTKVSGAYKAWRDAHVKHPQQQEAF